MKVKEYVKIFKESKKHHSDAVVELVELLDDEQNTLVKARGIKTNGGIMRLQKELALKWYKIIEKINMPLHTNLWLKWQNEKYTVHN